MATANGVHCCTSAGNNGNDSDPLTSSLLAPADAMDVLACGAVDANGTISVFSSDGPTADGRVKPEVMARGVSTWTIAAENTTDYNSVSGTSISSPLIASAVACLVQLHPEWTVDQMRTVLLNTAADFVANGQPDPLFVRGYGVINAHAAGLDCNLNTLLDACDLDCAADGGACNVPGCGLSADCNLDGIPDECEADCDDNGTADGCDIASCSPEDATCQDCNRNGVPDGCDEPFPQQGAIALDAATYVCESTMTLTVGDCGPDIDPGLFESVMVTVVSDSDAVGETVELFETAAGSGTFEADVELSANAASGELQVGDGDVVTITYIDADDGAGGVNVTVNAVAAVDCSAPIVSDVAAMAVGPFDATVSFTTNEPSAAVLRYGTACNALAQQSSAPGFQEAFEFALQDLLPTTTYYFVIDVDDPYGNEATFDNGGDCYTIDTPEVPNYFTEHFDGNDNDLDFRSIEFTPDGSVDVYAPCTYDILDLPTDPGGGTVLDVDSQDFVEINLPAGMEVSLYGMSYDTFYVGKYGYVTFEAGDDESFDTLVHHFDLPRIAALFDLIDPAEGGTVSWKLLADRVAVSWENVPEFFQGNINTFQIEMYFNGRIALNYLTIDASNGLAGLSAGTGVVAGFNESDFSSFGPCGAMPPAATDIELSTPVDTLLAVELLAVDDGLPEPPGALDYIVSALPQHGTLSDPIDGPIVAVPHVLAGGANTVHYTPEVGYGGLDGFTYHVNDGGTPPDGGDSNTSTVTITVGLPQVIYGFYLDEDPGWTTQGDWAFGQPTGGGSNDGDPTSGFSGLNVYGYNLDGDYDDDMPPTHLISTVLDCSQLVHTELRFQRWLGCEYSNFDKAEVSLSTNNIDWQTVWNNEGVTISDDAWMPRAFDISDLADGQATVFIRWTMGPTDFILTYPGWNIDDIEIVGVPTTSGCDALADCADLNDDGLRDDPCVFWACEAGACAGTDIGYADLGGSNGACVVDGATDGNDRCHALNCFSNQDTLGQSGYPCETVPPSALNVDAAGLNAPCTPDGVCDGNDAFAALNAFSGTTACSCDGGGPAPLSPETQFQEAATLQLKPEARSAGRQQFIEVSVFIKDGLADLRGYQLHSAVYEQADAGSLQSTQDLRLVDMFIHDGAGHVFAGQPFWDAYNLQTQQLLAGLDRAGLMTRPGAYLATLVYVVQDSARGTYVIDLLHDARDPTHRSILFATAEGRPVTIRDTEPAVVEVFTPRRNR